MASYSIRATNLGKTYKVPVRQPGLLAACRSLVKRESREVVAVSEVSLDVRAGEIVGLLGPNGAGKTTTLKMMSGLIHPSGGDIEVLGYTPFDRDRDFLRKVTLIMGNRNQLQWDLPVSDSFRLTRSIYGVPPSEFKATSEQLVELLDLHELIDKPVRNLSLGERMRCEFANSLLHSPEVLFLDEPTLGLDVSTQRRVRAFLLTYVQETGATVMLTSHYMADVEALCERIVLIDRGGVLFDGDLDELTSKIATHKSLRITLAESADLTRFGEVISSDISPTEIVMRIPRDNAPATVSSILRSHSVVDLVVEDPSIDDVIQGAFDR